MNDVHMSHAMEFPYPQSMANCVTCHEGKLDKVLSDANFTIETCKSCHPVNGAKAEAAEGEEPAYDTTKLALKTIIPPAVHANMDLNTTDCTTCHGEGKAAPGFKQIHTGYDKAIYTADGVRYSDAISVTIDSATLDGNKLDIKFKAGESPDIEGLDVADITPTVLVGLYGWDTKDFIVGPHERLTDDNNDGKIDGNDQRALEFEVGAEHPRMATVSAEDGQWEVTADLSEWADLIADGTVKRVEIGVLPALANADEAPVAIDAASKTFDLGANAFDDEFFGPIADVEKCENCHEALATTFHSPEYGGNVTVCRMCHITKAGGSHLEMQSRSLDSYVARDPLWPGFRRQRHRLRRPGAGDGIRAPHRVPVPDARQHELRVLSRRREVQRAGSVQVAAGSSLGVRHKRDRRQGHRRCAVLCHWPCYPGLWRMPPGGADQGR